MGINLRQGNNQLFRFKVPRLPELNCVVALSEVLAVLPLPVMAPLPFAPSYVIGLAEWQSQVVTILEMAAALSPTTDRELPSSSTLNCLTAQTIIDGRVEVIAWPILSEASAMFAPATAPLAGIPDQITLSMSRAYFLLNDEAFLWLNLEGLAEQIT